MTISRCDVRNHFSLGVSLVLNDGWVRPSRRGFTYDAPMVRIGFGPWLWKVVL